MPIASLYRRGCGRPGLCGPVSSALSHLHWLTWRRRRSRRHVDRLGPTLAAMGQGEVLGSSNGRASTRRLRGAGVHGDLVGGGRERERRLVFEHTRAPAPAVPGTAPAAERDHG